LKIYLKALFESLTPSRYRKIIKEFSNSFLLKREIMKGYKKRTDMFKYDIYLSKNFSAAVGMTEGRHRIRMKNKKE